MSQGKPLIDLTLITEEGIAYPLFGGRPANFIYLDGAGMAPVERILQNTPQQHGLIDRGFRFGARRMILSLLIQASTEQVANQERDKLAHMFGPTESPLLLRATRYDRTRREIACYTDGTVDFQQSSRTGTMMNVYIPLVAPDPMWRDPTQQSVTQSLSTGSADLNNVGNQAGCTGEEYPVFRITGPATNLNILHSPVADVIGMTGTIPSGETWVFDLRPGYKTVTRQSDGALRMSFINVNSLYAFHTMRILSEKVCVIYNQVANGFIITATACTAASSANMTWYKKYLSL